MVRDCDFHLGVAQRDIAILLHVYYGSPFPSYRKKVKEKLRDLGAPLPDAYDWRPGTVLNATSERHHKTLCIENGELLPKGSGLKPGQVLHRLIIALCSDFYRPHSVARLHESLFPDQHFNPKSSPDLVRQAVLRLRAWTQEQKLGFEVVECGNGSYRLDSARDVGRLRIKTQREDAPFAREFDPLKLRTESFRAKLEMMFDHSKPFRAKTVANAFGLPQRTANRMLTELVAEGCLEKIGSGRSPLVSYRLVGVRKEG